jgi:ATP-binding cassette subfamily B protein
MSRPKTLNQVLPSFWRIARRLWPFMRRQRLLIVGSTLALVAGTLFRLLEPWPLKFVFDRVLRTGHKGRLPHVAAFDSLDPITVLTLAAVTVVGVAILRALTDYFNTVGFTVMGNRVLTELRHELYVHLQRLPLSFHTRARGGDLTIRVIQDVNMLKDATVTAVLPLLANVLILIGMWTVMVWLEWRLALLALVTFPLLWLRTTHLTRRIREAASKQRARQGAMAATAAESMGAIKVVQALSLEGMFADAFIHRSKKSQKEDIKASILSASLERTVDVLVAISTGMVLWYGARLVLANELTPGELLVFLTYLRRAFAPVQDFAKYTARLAKATAAGERILDLLDRKPEIRDLPGAVSAPILHGAVAFEGVQFGYENGAPVLHDVDFSVSPGEHVALVGPSGIGKSTLLDLLLRLYDPVKGRVLIDGRDIREYKLESLRSQISVVLQDNLLFSATLRDNIAYGAPDATLDAIEAAAHLANAHEFICATPQGYDAEVGERGVTLSHGQRQRIAIARAAIKGAPILILDEPTSGLDEENSRAVIEALERLTAGRTTFLVSHDLRLASRADLILFLEHGNVIERGTHTELTLANGRYAKLYRMQTNANDVEVDKVGPSSLAM